MEFPKIGDKYRSKYNGTTVKVLDVDRGERIVQLEGEIVRKYYMDYWHFRDTYSKIPSEIEPGSRWINQHKSLITVISVINDVVKYYYGEAYCFSKIEHNMEKCEFLNCMAELRGNLKDYNISGLKTDMITYWLGGRLCVQPNAENKSINVDNTYVVPTESEEETNIEQEIFDTMFQNHMEDVSNEFIYGSDFKNWSNLKKYMAKLEDTNVLIVCGSQKQAGERRKEFSVDNEENVYGSHNFMMRNVVQVVSREYEGTCFKADLVIFDDCDNLDQNTKNNRLERLRFSENPRYEVWEQDSQVSSTRMMFAEKKPLWKRILRKLV